MNISYNKLWKLLIDNQMKKTDLLIAAKISTGTLSKLSKNAPVKLEVLTRICEFLKCDIGDVVEYVGSEGTINREVKS